MAKKLLLHAHRFPTLSRRCYFGTNLVTNTLCHVTNNMLAAKCRLHAFFDAFCPCFLDRQSFFNALLFHTRNTCVVQAESSAPQHQAPSAQHRYVTKVDATNSRHWHATDGSTPKQTTSCCRQNQQLTLPHASQPDCATLLAITPMV